MVLSIRKKWVVDLIFDVAGYVSGVDLSVAAMGATTLRCGVCKAVSFAPFRHAGLGFLVFRFLV